MSVAYASSEIYSPWLFVSDISDVIFGTSLPRFVGEALLIDVLLRLSVDMLLRLSIDVDASGRRAMYL